MMYQLQCRLFQTFIMGGYNRLCHGENIFVLVLATLNLTYVILCLTKGSHIYHHPLCEDA